MVAMWGVREEVGYPGRLLQKHFEHDEALDQPFHDSSGSIYSRMLGEVPQWAPFGPPALQVCCQSVEWTGQVEQV